MNVIFLPRIHQHQFALHKQPTKLTQTSSGAAGASIWGRFLQLVAGVENQHHVGNQQPKKAKAKADDAHGADVDALLDSLTPPNVLKVTPEALHSTGMSAKKASSVLDLARHFDEGHMDDMESLSDDEIRYVPVFACIHDEGEGKSLQENKERNAVFQIKRYEFMVICMYVEQ